MINKQTEIALYFAKSLDRGDYESARVRLADCCLYRVCGQTTEGAETVVDSYQRHRRTLQGFEEVAHYSGIRDEVDGWIVVEFCDKLEHRGRTHRYRYELGIWVENGLIVAIEHRDLEEEVESLAAFKKWCHQKGEE